MAGVLSGIGLYLGSMRNCYVCGQQTVVTKTSRPICAVCKKERNRERNRAHKQTTKYKEWVREYVRRPATKARNQEAKRRYRQTDKYRQTERAREETPEMREKRRLFSASERGKINNKKYQATPKGKATRKAITARYRALREAAEGNLTASEWLEILRQHKHRCYYCKRKMQNLTMDHVIPLSKGGSHTKENIVPACRSCNSRKHNKIVRLL